VALIHNRKIPVHAMAFAEMCLLLNQDGHTRIQLRDKLGLNQVTINNWITLLIRRKLIYICDWVPPIRGNFTPVWAWGYCVKDVPKPPPMTKTQYQQRYVAKKRRTFGLTGVSA